MLRVIVRTNLVQSQTTTARIKAATMHLKGVKLAIMGCIVKGPAKWRTRISDTSEVRPGRESFRRQNGGKIQHPEADAFEACKI